MEGAWYTSIVLALLSRASGGNDETLVVAPGHRVFDIRTMLAVIRESNSSANQHNFDIINLQTEAGFFPGTVEQRHPHRHRLL